MTTSGNDGRIILSTEIDTNGIKDGALDIKNISSETSKSIHKLGIELSKALNIGDSKTAQLINNFRKATKEVEKQSGKVDELKNKLQGLESGNIKIENNEVLKLQNDFNRATEKVRETQSEINELYAQLDKLQMDAFKAPDTGNIVFTEKEQAQFDKLNLTLDELEPRLEANKQKANELGIALKNAAGLSTQSEINKTKSKLEEAENKLQDLSVKAEIAGQKMNGNMNSYQTEVSAAEKAVSNLGKRISRLAVSALVFSAITKAFTAFRENIGAALMSNEEFRASVEALQASLWVVSQPIYEAMLPALQSLIRWLTIGMLYIAAFFGGLSGKSIEQTIANAKALNKQAQAFESTSKSASKTTKSTKGTTKAIKDLTKATKEANKELAAFDDIIIIGQKSIDDVQTPSGTGGVSIPNVSFEGFENLENMLTPEDMEGITKFGNWVMENKDNIKLALEVAGFGAAGIGVASLVKNLVGPNGLIKAFSKKDSSLDTQKPKLETETSLVNDLSWAWALAPGLAYGFGKALDGLTKKGELEYVPAFQAVKDTTNEFGSEAETAKNKSQLLTPKLQSITSAAWGLIPAFQDAYKTITPFSSALDTTKESVGELFKTVSSKMPSIATAISGAFLSASESVIKFTENSSTNIFEWGSVATTNMGVAARLIAKAIYDSLSNADLNIKLFAIASATKFQAIAETAGNMMSKVASALSTAFSALGAIGKNTSTKTTTSSSNKGINWAGIGSLVLGAGLTAAAVLTPIPGDEVAAGAAFVNAARLFVPGLAKGTVLPGGKPYLAIVNDQPAGQTNIEAPLQTIVDAFNIALQGNTNYGGGNTEVVLEIDGREFGRAVVEQGKRENQRIGTRLVIV